MDGMTPADRMAGRAGPLSGLLVLDFGQAAVGPIAAEYLGMLGATVIKVESPKGDTVRNGSPTMNGTSTTFIGNNLGKFGVVLDLKSPEGNARAKDLIRIADVLIENFRSNEVMVRLGLGYDVLRALNPDLVYVSSSAYGAGGPLENMRSNEWLTEAFSGFTSVTGAEHGPGEFSRGTANLDWNGAMINTVALLAALVRRSRKGGGGYFITSQLGSSIYGGVTRFAAVLAGETAVPLGAASAHIAPDDAFVTSDGHIAVSAPTQRCWKRLCTAVGRADLQDDARFATNADRLAARPVLTAILSEIFATATTAHWDAVLGGTDIPCAAVPHDGTTLLEAMQADPQISALNLLRRIPSAYGTVASQAPHWTFERTPAGIASGPPLQGEHTELVLSHLDSKAALIGALAGAAHAEAA